MESHVTHLLFLGTELRLALLMYSGYQDVQTVKFTDIDYLVFKDGSRYVSLGLSPYLRDTYRSSVVR
jgi:hypothetical protein